MLEGLPLKEAMQKEKVLGRSHLVYWSALGRRNSMNPKNGKEAAEQKGDDREVLPRAAGIEKASNFS